MNFAKIAERLIEEAMAEGRFDNLPGAGKPLPDLPAGDPFDIIMGRIMARSGVVPAEVELKRTIAERTRAAARLDDPDKLKAEMAEIAVLRMKLDVALKGRG